MSAPSSHLDEYDRSIEMLNLCVDQEVQLTQEEFQCFMRDKWGWERSFLVGSSQYSASATKKLSLSENEQEN